MLHSTRLCLRLLGVMECETRADAHTMARQGRQPGLCKCNSQWQAGEVAFKV